ncbi:MAG: TetR/AcrR family transcriptional regulator [Candidatus Bathyarchaeia archaeon]|jgi:AcrR family transcriptional regulator
MTQKTKTGRPTKNPIEKETAEKIFDAAIDLFAQQGYDNVSVRDIAKAVGIKESSIYKHYTNKEQILQKIIQYPLAKMYSIAAREDTTEQIIVKMGFEGFISDCSEVFISWILDPSTVKIMRIFYIELYHNKEISQSFTALIDASETFWASVFAILMKQELIAPADPAVLSSEFLSFFWKTFAYYFLVEYGRTSKSFVQLYQDSFTKHLMFFIKAIDNRQNEFYSDTLKNGML